MTLIKVINLLAVVSLVIGCGEDLVTVQNEGSACFSAEPPEPYGGLPSGPGEFVVGEPLYVTTVLVGCASGCAHIESASCSVEIDGDGVWQIKARGTYSEGGGVCPSVCTEIKASCETPPIEAGTLVFRYAGETTSVEVPSSPMKAPCIGKSD